MNITCPACGSEESTLLGQLGNQRWFRCRACGMDHSRTRGTSRRRRPVTEIPPLDATGKIPREFHQ